MNTYFVNNILNSILSHIISVNNHLLWGMNHKLLLINIGSYIKVGLLSINYDLIPNCLILSNIGRMLLTLFLFYNYLLIHCISIVFILIC